MIPFYQKKWGMDDNEHKCSLDPQESIMSKYISGGYCVEFRRLLKQWTMVSETNPRSKIYLKSAPNIRREKMRHLESHYYMIHPFSDLKCYWEFFMIFVLAVLMVVVPVLLCMQEPSMPMLRFRYALDMICLMDIIMTFSTGYQDNKTKKVILERKKVAIHYLKTWFTVDFLSSFHVDIFFILWKPDHSNPEHTKIYLLNLLKVLKMLRIFTLVVYMNRLREYYQYSFFSFKIINAILVTCLLLLWNTSILFFFGKELDETWLINPKDQRYFYENLKRCFLTVFDLFLLLNNYATHSAKLFAFELPILLFGAVFQIFILAQIMGFVRKHKVAENNYNDKKKQLDSYMHNKQVHKSLAKRSQNYFDFKFHRSYYRESEIVQTVSSTLRDEIRFHTSERLFQSIDILKDIPASVTTMLTSLMEEEIYLPNDIITKAGDVGNCMYFISTGMVAVYTPGGKEVCHITTGGIFGEVCLMMEHSSRIATVVAIDYCDVYVLSRKNFLKVVETQPELYKKAMAISKKRMAQVLFMEHTRNRPTEFHDLRTPEGVNHFKQSLYEL